MPGRLYIGLMSGTSLDGVDGVLADTHPADGSPLRVRAHAHDAFAPTLHAELLALNTPGDDELARAALAGNAVARAYAAVVERLLAKADVPRESVRAIGAHGQTVRHRPGAVDGTGYTLQLGNAALLAELAGIDVVADFRSRDIAAGGQGAPLVPAFHRAMFAHAGETVLVLNIGGIANLSVIADEATIGFDCGPGNALMDHWCELHTGAAFDDAGRWAASGRVIEALLRALLAEPYLALPAPKSTGRDLFNPAWLAPALATHATSARLEDVQATLAEFTARSIADAVGRHASDAQRLIVCGGGACNAHLLARLAALLPGITVQSSDAHGLPAQQVEAAAYAWLAERCVERRPGNLASVTGAAGPRVLGAVYGK
jgi:anhydro-N-acetylmuramic acid kinase